MNTENLKEAVRILSEGLFYCKDYFKNNIPERPLSGGSSIGCMVSDIEDYLDLAAKALNVERHELDELV